MGCRTNSDYAEDHLQPGQAPIETQGVKRLGNFMRLLIDSKKRHCPTMGVITGRSGIGKTIAIQTFVDNFGPRSYTGLPPIIKIKMISSSTPKAVVKSILAALQDKREGFNRQELAELAAEALDTNEVELLIVDEADPLTDLCFNTLRNIHDMSGCPIALVGLPNILKVILRQEKFASRVGIETKFPECTRDEVLTVVLPNIVVPCWEYDPARKEDLILGGEIFKLVGSSLRRLRQLLDRASQFAERAESPRITLGIIKEAYKWLPFRRKEGKKQPAEEPEEGERGEYEQKSEERREAKSR